MSKASREPQFKYVDKSRLTEREQEVLEMYWNCRGDIAMIQDTLKIEYTTVKTHMNSLFRKLNVHSQVELVFAILDRKLVPNV